LTSRYRHRGSRKQYYGERKLVDKYQTRIDKAANDYNRTKDEKYKKLWYDLIRKVDNGFNYSKRRTIPTDTSVKTDIGWNSVDKRN
jgi:hypothetical protein